MNELKIQHDYGKGQGGQELLYTNNEVINKQEEIDGRWRWKMYDVRRKMYDVRERKR